ncbi:MAG: DUF1059 domain-containing protein [Candidatus Limnocylindria bacterium]
MSRKMFDCREWPGPCTLAISGTEDEVMETQIRHLAEAHRLADTPEIRAQILASLKEDPSELSPETRAGDR